MIQQPKDESDYLSGKQSLLTPTHQTQVLVIRATPTKNSNQTGIIWKIPPWFTKEEYLDIKEQKIKVEDVIQQLSLNPKRQIVIENAAVGDNIIVISHKSVVYVLLWHPAIPLILTQKKQQQSWNQATKLALLAYQSLQLNQITVEQQNINNNLSTNDSIHNITNNQLPQQNQNLQTDIKLPMRLQAVCTLKFDSDVTSLAAVTICGHQFIVVCLKEPNMARIFRLNSIKDDIEFQKKNKKIWDLVNQPKFQQSKWNIFNILHQPGSNPLVPPTQQFIPLNKQQDQYLLNLNCLKLTITPIIDMKLNNPASSCLITTFEKQVKRMGPEEDIMPNENLYGLNLKIEQFSFSKYKYREKLNKNNPSLQQQLSPFNKLNVIQKDQYYKAHEGALLLVGGQYGIAEFVVIPLAALLLDVHPLRFPAAIDVLKIGMQCKEKKLQHSLHELFTFPPESQFMDLGRSPVQISEDNRYVIIKGERSYIVRFDPFLGRTVWHMLFNQSGIKNIVTVGVQMIERIKLNARKLKKKKKKILHLQMKMMKKIQSNNLQNQIEQQLNPDSADSISMTSTSDLSSTLSSIERDEQQLRSMNSKDLKIPNPNIAWIGNESNSQITFGVISKQQAMNKQVKQLPSVPIAISHLAPLHAIAVLIREEFKYMNVDAETDEDQNVDGQDSESSFKFKQDDESNKQTNEVKLESY
ncbi:MAG: hypothetical protein EZS28_017749 [Streblomastix strix]|uniref:Uncharacterized protein n=1 Tax=Streblomastix strix TaxID=222440 RepID=A0A5J4VWL9_9EUKA|nr:MAG: hypothetical protein EZS28_017749 [Streblomastix strix]